MYNKRTIIPGLAIFIAVVTFPLWFNAFSTASPTPKPQLPPGGEKQCVAPASEMRASHMQLLNEWRDEVLRDGERQLVTVDGKQYGRGLQLACMQCHTSKEKFCDSCHEYASVKPYCWDCHLSPEEEALKKETL